MAEVALLTEEPSLRGTLRRLAPFLRPHALPAVVAVTLTLSASLAWVLVAPMVGAITAAVLDADRDGVLVAGLVLLGLAVARTVLSWAGELLLAVVGERVVRGIREKVVDRLAAAPLRFVEAHRGGELLTRATTEIELLSTFVRSQLPAAVSVLGYLVFAVVVLVAYSWLLAALLLVLFVPLSLLVMRSFERAAGSAFTAEAAARAAVAAAFGETVAAREAVQAAGAEQVWGRRFAERTGALLAAVRRTIRALNRLPLAVAVEAVTTAALLAAGGALIAAGRIDVPTVAVFVVATRTLFDSFTEATGLVGEFQESRVAVARLTDLLAATGPAAPAAPAPDARPARRPAGPGRLVLDGVGFGYTAGTPVLDGVSVTVEPGERLALVGRTGAGKSTLAKVVAGLYPPDRGRVTVDGTPLDALGPGELRHRVALVGQQVHVAAGSVLDNVTLVLGTPGRDEVERAVDALGLRRWIAGLGGLDADLGARGDRLSAGERQVLGLIRAALVAPAVLVLDEATADLDPTTAGLLEGALERIRDASTLVVIAHRPDTVARMDRVVTLDGGRVVADTGTPTEGAGSALLDHDRPRRPADHPAHGAGGPGR
ncbi:ABC transporter ATP-binding protein [Pseudonocardia kongjuensis]|uniref:ABC transporter ATP-binding protein n=1 Tax=Pseudonocardia kongjuensis TaxID=102227 RepID=A0ABP4IYM8_9PSEU